MARTPNLDANREFVNDLWEVYENVRNTLDENDEYLKNIRKTKLVKVDHILELAKRMSFTQHAPVGWKEGHPLINAFPPVPQPEQMRVGKLAVYNESISEQKKQQLTTPSVSTILSAETLQKTNEKRKAFAYMLKLKEQMNLKRESETTAMETDGATTPGDSANPAEEEQPDVTSTRRVNISFGGFDSDDEDDD